jgi:hypothetical protein
MQPVDQSATMEIVPPVAGSLRFSLWSARTHICGPRWRGSPRGWARGRARPLFVASGCLPAPPGPLLLSTVFRPYFRHVARNRDRYAGLLGVDEGVHGIHHRLLDDLQDLLPAALSGLVWRSERLVAMGSMWGGVLPTLDALPPCTVTPTAVSLEHGAAR